MELQFLKFLLDIAQYYAVPEELKSRLPTFRELAEWYGPYLALVLRLVIALLVMQFVWFSRVIRAKNAEISRLIKKESDIYERLHHLIDRIIGFQK